jgi:hypothetical protein
MKKMKKVSNIIKRLAIGFKKGYLTPTLPSNIIKIQTYPIIRIFRFLGGISFLFILSKNHLNYPSYIFYLSILFSFLFTIYHIIISYFRIKHIIYLLKSDQLDVKNSPLDKIATLGAKALLCFKGTCETAQPIGLTLGIMLGADEILKNANREPIFAPFLGDILNKILPEGISKDSTKLINKNINQLENNNEDIKENDSLLSRFKDLNLKGDISNTEFTELQKLISEHKESIIENNAQIKSKIIQLLEEKNNK